MPGLDALQDLVNAGLVTSRDDGVIVAQLAEAVPSVDNGLWQVFPDGHMQTRLTLRPNVAWQDGTPLTAADLVFTTEVEQDQARNGSRAVALRAFASACSRPGHSTMTPSSARSCSRLPTSSWRSRWVDSMMRLPASDAHATSRGVEDRLSATNGLTPYSPAQMANLEFRVLVGFPV